MGVARFALHAGREPGLAIVTVRAGEAQKEVAVEFVAPVPGQIQVSDAVRRVSPFDPEAVVEAARHPMALADGVATARGEAYQLHFDGSEMTFALQGTGSEAQLGFTLLTVRVGRTVLYSGRGETAPLTAQANRTRAVRAAGLHEEYVALDEGVEQVFTIEQKPSRSGELVIEGVFHTPLRPELASDREGIHFLDGQGRPVLGYSRAVARDALGREQVARLALDGRRVQITVPEGWLREARYPLTVDPLIGDPVLVSGWGSYTPAVAYNPDDDEWLVVWHDNWNGGNWDIHGQRMRSDGTLIGDNLAIAENPSYQGAPAVAYNPAAGEYLIVWKDERVSGEWHIYGQRVRADGTLVGSEMTICAAPYYQLDPAVTYQPATEEWLVVWHSQRADGIQIYGQRIASSGALVGSEFAISQEGYSHRGPDVAANPEAGEYLAVWHMHTNNLRYSLRARRVQADGTPSGDEMIIAQARKDSPWPKVAYNPHDDEYLVVWQDRRNGNWDIYGQRVSAAGALVGDNLAIATSGGNQTCPAVAWDGRSHRYLVVWEEGDSIRGQRVWSDGALDGGPLTLAPVGWSPDLWR